MSVNTFTLAYNLLFVQDITSDSTALQGPVFSLKDQLYSLLPCAEKPVIQIVMEGL